MCWGVGDVPRIAERYDPQAQNACDVLIVEDDGAIAELLETVLQAAGFRTRVAGSGHQALAAIERRRPGLVLLDLGLPGLYGASLAVALRMRWPGLSFIIVSALHPAVVAEDAWKIGAAAYFTKPFDCCELVALVQRVLAAPRRIAVCAASGAA